MYTVVYKINYWLSYNYQGKVENCTTIIIKFRKFIWSPESLNNFVVVHCNNSHNETTSRMEINIKLYGTIVIEYHIWCPLWIVNFSLNKQNMTSTSQTVNMLLHANHQHYGNQFSCILDVVYQSVLVLNNQGDRRR